MANTGVDMKASTFLSTSHLPANWTTIADKVNTTLKDLNGTDTWTRKGDKFETSETLDNCAVLGRLAGVTCDGNNFLGCSADAADKDACVNIVATLHSAVTGNPAIGFDYDKLRDDIKKMDPAVAFNILNGFGFGYYLDKKKTGPYAGLSLYRTEPAKDWVRELYTKAKPPTCSWQLGSKPGSSCPSIDKRMHSDIYDRLKRLLELRNPADAKTLELLVQYFEILVNWLDANPSALNKELNSNPSFVSSLNTNVKAPTDAYKLYSWQPGPHKIELKTHYDNMCSLDRLKATIVGQSFNAGTNGNFLSTNIINTPSNLSSFFNTRAFNMGLSGAMFGGFDNVASAAQALQAMNLQSYYGGHEYFHNLYEQVINSMELFGNGLTLSKNAKDKVNDKLQKFKDAEETLVKEIKEFHEKVQVYKASRGQIDPFSLKDDEWKSIEQKHASLLQRTNALNNRAVQLIDIIQALNKAMLDKFSGSQQIYAPLQSGIHYP